MVTSKGTGLIVDVETTGLSPFSDEIIEIGMILFSFSPRDGRILRIIETYQSFRQPSCRLSPYAQKVHGINHHDINGHCPDHSKVDLLIAQSEFIIAHNAQFDHAFFSRLYPSSYQYRWFCSMSGIQWRKKGTRSRRLSELCDHFGITVNSPHRALVDASMTLKLLSVIGSEGTTHLYELLNSRPYWDP